MATISFVTPEEHAVALQRIERLEKLLEAYVSSQEEGWIQPPPCAALVSRPARP